MSFETFYKDLTDYFVDIEFTDFDKTRVEGIFKRNVPSKIVEKPKIIYKEIIKERVIYRNQDNLELNVIDRKIDVKELFTERDNIFKAICNFWGLGCTEVLSASRERCLVYCRYHSFVLMRKIGMTIDSIGKYFNRDHTTIINGLKTASDLIETKAEPFYSMWVGWQKKSMSEVPGKEEPE
jgi:hypothetical protein